jgi:hypothetical protein
MPRNLPSICSDKAQKFRLHRYVKECYDDGDKEGQEMRPAQTKRSEVKTNRPMPLFGLHDITDKRERESEQKRKTKIVNVAEKTFWS